MPDPIPDTQVLSVSPGAVLAITKVGLDLLKSQKWCRLPAWFEKFVNVGDLVVGFLAELIHYQEEVGTQYVMEAGWVRRSLAFLIAMNSVILAQQWCVEQQWYQDLKSQLAQMIDFLRMQVNDVSAANEEAEAILNAA